MSPIYKLSGEQGWNFRDWGDFCWFRHPASGVRRFTLLSVCLLHFRLISQSRVSIARSQRYFRILNSQSCFQKACSQWCFRVVVSQLLFRIPISQSCFTIACSQ